MVSLQRFIRSYTSFVAFAFLLSTTFAQTGAHVPSYGAEMPKYWSGTNSRAIGSLYIYPPIQGIPIMPWFETANLYVGGELVATWVRPPEDIPISGLQLRVMFDSSHFAPNSMVDVRITGTDNLGRFYDSNIDDPTPNFAPVKNWACLYGRFDMEVSYLNKDDAGGWVHAYNGDETPYRGLPSSFSRLQGMNYEVKKKITTIGWTAQDFYYDSQVANVLHLRSHAREEFAFSDTDDYWFEYLYNQPGPARRIYGALLGSGAPPGSAAMLPSRQEANGTGLPPYNSTGLPPINIALIYGCNTGVNNSFAEGTLYPYGNVYAGTSEFPENQSCVGTAMKVISSQARNVHEAFWGALEEGYTVNEARFEAYYAYQEKKPDSAEEFMHVWGDFFAKLKGVYYPSAASDSDDWVRPI